MEYLTAYQANEITLTIEPLKILRDKKKDDDLFIEILKGVQQLAYKGERSLSIIFYTSFVSPYLKQKIEELGYKFADGVRINSNGIKEEMKDGIIKW